MPKSALYLHYMAQAKETTSICDLDSIIANSYNDYMRDRISYEEYGRIYFRCVSEINSLSNGTR